MKKKNKIKICIVRSTYYTNIANNLTSGALKVLNKNKFTLKNVKILEAPGVFEIPFVISKNIKKYDAFLALACVIKGETPHFNFISTAATNGIMTLSTKYKKPILNGIITSLNRKQAVARSVIGKKNKGAEAANALIALWNL